MSGVTWVPAARAALAGFAKDDPGGADQVFDSVALLLRDPRPAGARPWGPDRFRIHIGRYRVVYVIKRNKPVVITVEHVGRVG
ncbi:type II toxin-antitoxin system RelE/ParE family toxin [Streptomyces sp. LP05-1]|uniref:Type II toxin-antitoxin system RelE/ParE family toxin n=1 Tax=Streptomyces pyxinae TaxID=2970734 RepID=A0ABT2CQI0_9ACTN|nr:type II toxin-antitoxin system RelE/ParE family toxin [Streptomyces sp. LP05-1]MCS0639695.1 type II toxin-antitoxin system RelE/ParE family toxin [Streptomyces sp. LP05-1]